MTASERTYNGWLVVRTDAVSKRTVAVESSAHRTLKACGCVARPSSHAGEAIGQRGGPCSALARHADKDAVVRAIKDAALYYPGAGTTRSLRSLRRRAHDPHAPVAQELVSWSSGKPLSLTDSG